MAYRINKEVKFQDQIIHLNEYFDEQFVYTKVSNGTETVYSAAENKVYLFNPQLKSWDVSDNSQQVAQITAIKEQLGESKAKSFESESGKSIEIFSRGLTIAMKAKLETRFIPALKNTCYSKYMKYSENVNFVAQDLAADEVIYESDIKLNIQGQKINSVSTVKDMQNQAEVPDYVLSRFTAVAA